MVRLLKLKLLWVYKPAVDAVYIARLDILY